MVLKPCLLPLLLKWFQNARPPGLMNNVWDASVVRVFFKVEILTKRLHRVAFVLPPSPDVQYSIGRRHRREGLQRSVVIVEVVHKAKNSLQALGRLCGCSAWVDSAGATQQTEYQGNLTTTEQSIIQRLIAWKLRKLAERLCNFISHRTKLGRTSAVSLKSLSWCRPRLHIRGQSHNRCCWHRRRRADNRRRHF